MIKTVKIVTILRLLGTSFVFLRLFNLVAFAKTNVHVKINTCKFFLSE